MLPEVSQLVSTKTLQSAKLVMEAASQRHKALASNIANVNTPGYQRQDLSPSFAAEMNSALKKIEGGSKLSEIPQAQIAVEKKDLFSRYDGNTVNLDEEMMHLMENQARFDFAAQVVARNYAGLKSAMRTGTGR